MDRLNLAFIQAKRSKKLLALLFLDIDHLKGINDTLGHAAGDKILKTFASRIKKIIRASDTIARLGGDEFVLLLDEITDRDNAIKIAKKIIIKIKEPIIFKKKNLKISTSIGIAFYKNNKIDIDELINQADQALYSAKKSGRNSIKIYTTTD